jgi:hypothetical protein
MRRVYAISLAAISLVGVAGCRKGGGGSGGKAADAQKMLAEFVKPGADAAALTNALRPKPEDYDAAFVADTAPKIKAAAEALWDGGKITISPPADRTEVNVAGTTIDEIKKGEGNSSMCPHEYKDFVDKLKPGNVIYCFRFVKPGEKLSTKGDTIMYLDGRWVFFPKPWRLLNKS